MAMAEPQPPASLLVPAIVRQVQADGGFATVLAKGSPFGSALLIVTREGQKVEAFEKLPSLDDAPRWRLAAEGDSAVAQFVERQRRFDTDLWVLELDIARPARFVPGLPSA
ncbi:DUF1491 family protein [Sandaracinobacter sp. RS1-74]|uniref:DUF1491 family protein n=1 Tax=Sandaracinobacteroides sayramensis TaxID=2913411 RepID=UPI001EDBA391|nr:DUF1491 family protein [Sandaracinobacteroides sayramensis]MCG2841876.1 DUF1491 family protein [Sandaracinobacteroides sayramensis]